MTVQRNFNHLFGNYYKIDSNFEAVELDQSLKDNMELSNDFVVTDKDGDKFIKLFTSIDPQDSFERYDIFYYLYNLHLIGKKDVSPDDIYVKVIEGEDDGDGNATNNVYGFFKLLLEKYNNFTNIDYGNIPQSRSDWKVSGVLREVRESDDILRDLCKMSFVCLFTGRTGRLTTRAWLDDNNFNSHRFDESNIIRDTIQPIDKSATEFVYNNINIEYDYNKEEDEYKSKKYINNVDKEEYNEDYTNIDNGESVWNKLRFSYLKNRSVNDLPDDLSKLKWYYDDNTISEFIERLILWCSDKKNMIQFDVKITHDTLVLELLDNSTFNDSVVTGGEDIDGFITGLDHSQEDRVTVSMMTYPIEPIALTQYIDERFEGEDEIDESGVFDEVYDESDNF